MIKSFLVLLCMITLSFVCHAEINAPANFQWENNFYDPIDDAATAVKPKALPPQYNAWDKVDDATQAVRRSQYDQKTIQEVGEGLRMGTQIWKQRQPMTPTYPLSSPRYPNYSYQVYVYDLRQQQAAWQAYQYAVMAQRQRQLQWEVAQIYGQRSANVQAKANLQQGVTTQAQEQEQYYSAQEATLLDSNVGEPVISTTTAPVPDTSHNDAQAETTFEDAYQSKADGLTSKQLYALKQRELDILAQKTAQDFALQSQKTMQFYDALQIVVELAAALGLLWLALRVVKWTFTRSTE